MSQMDLRQALDAMVGEPALDGGLFDRVAGGIRRRRRRTGAAVVAAVAAVMLGSPLAIHALTGPRPEVPVAHGDAANRAATERDVAARIAAFPRMAGLIRLRGPLIGGPRIADPWYGDPGPNQVVRTEWFEYPGPMHDVIMSFGAAKVAGQSPSGQTGFSDDGFGVFWQWPDLPPVTVWRSAWVSATRNGDGVLLRIDADAYWMPVRPPDLAIGPRVASVAVVVQTKEPGMGDPSVPARTFGPTTITDPTRVGAVVALVNTFDMAVPVPRPISCPIDFGGSMRVDFTDRAGRPLYRLTMTLSGCRSISLTRTDGPTTRLWAPVDGGDPANEILSLLGLDWTWSR